MQEDIKISSYNGFLLQLPNCMYVFLTSFWMHGICMWIIDHDLSLAWRIAWIDSGLLSLAISWIAMEIMGLFPCFVLVGSHVS